VPQAAAWLPKRAPQKNSDLPGVVAASQLMSYGQHNFIHFFLVGGFNHLEKYESQWLVDSPIYCGKKCLKPPTSCLCTDFPTYKVNKKQIQKGSERRLIMIDITCFQ
jgi:hypothetical protein